MTTEEPMETVEEQPVADEKPLASEESQPEPMLSSTELSSRTSSRDIITQRSNETQDDDEDDSVIIDPMTPEVRSGAPLFGKLPNNGVLTKERVAEGLSCMGRSADGLKHVYLKLTLSRCGLADISLASRYIHIQEVDVSFNSITDLSPLGAMANLLRLNASHNRLTKILDFEPPLNLQEVNLSYNSITAMVDLSAHKGLRKLILDHNKITQIEGVRDCQQITCLSLCHNMIERMENLDGLRLRELYLSGNAIREIENIETLDNLSVLDLSYNHIRSMKGLENHGLLHTIRLQSNEIGDVAEVKYIRDLPLLRDLNLRGNPLQEMDNYRLALVFRVQCLKSLDGDEVTAEEKVKAVNKFDPPPEVVAAIDHATHVTRALHQPAHIRASTPVASRDVSRRRPFQPIVLFGPSGVGKRTMTRRLCNDFPDDVSMAISHTTRAPREGEMDGVDYYFVDPETMAQMIEDGKFIETSVSNGAMYGLSGASVEEIAEAGKVCIINMEFEGVMTLKRTYLACRYILILPPSSEELQDRIRRRGANTEAQIAGFVDKLGEYESYAAVPGFADEIIINEDPEVSYAVLKTHLPADIRKKFRLASHAYFNPPPRNRQVEAAAAAGAVPTPPRGSPKSNGRQLRISTTPTTIVSAHAPPPEETHQPPTQQHTAHAPPQHAPPPSSSSGGSRVSLPPQGKNVHNLPPLILPGARNTPERSRSGNSGRSHTSRASIISEDTSEDDNS